MAEKVDPLIVLKNLASNAPLARLKATGEAHAALRAALDELADQALLEQVRAARAPSRSHSWREIGDALGISHTQAQRRYAGRGVH